MMDPTDLRGFYVLLPTPLRTLAATLYGYWLEGQRYGPETDVLIEEAKDRESWNADRIRRWQESRLARVLDQSARTVPYYRRLWSERRIRGDRSSWESLENWPILEKIEVQNAPAAFIPDDINQRVLHRDCTSGTTGTPLTVWRSTETLRMWSALYDLRVHSWNGVSRLEPWVMLGGRLVVPYDRKERPFWVHNRAMRQLYMSSYHLAREFIAAYSEALHEFRPRYILGYASSLYSLGILLRDHGATPPPITVAINSSEPLHDYQRKAISEVFACPVTDFYSMVETVCASSECSEGALHIWPEVGFIEVIDQGDRAVAPGVEGHIVGTSLLNLEMPLIRYRTGDYGALKAVTQRCRCGRGLPTMGAVTGKFNDMLVTRDGRRIGRITPIFQADLHIRQGQIIQESLDRIVVKVVPAPGFSPEEGKRLLRHLSERLGDVQAELELVDAIPRSAAGKYRAVISRVTSDSGASPPECHQ